jgi:adenosylcobinamide-phosphate synthase
MFVPGLPAFVPGVDPFVVLLIALTLDALIGDPSAFYRRVSHPVVAIGAMVRWFENRFNDPRATDRRRFWLGLATTILVVVVAAICASAATWLTRQFNFGWLVEAVLASTLIAFRGLYDAVGAVARGFGQSVDEARIAVAHIVGRDPETLDGPGIARAAIESAAENFADGVVAPIFWYALFGLPGLAAYKAINTLDSMIGYRDERHLWFGKAAARLDDVVNWLPARIAGVLFCLAAGLMPGARSGPAWQTMWRDAAKHRSPNAGWPEAAAAGALGLALAGPRTYGTETVDDPWLGDGRRNATASDVHAARRLYLWAGGCAAAVIAVLALV